MMWRITGWLAVAAAVPLGCWVFAPANASWAGTDDRIGELAQPAGSPLVNGPEWSPATERVLFLSQSGLGCLLLGGSIWALHKRRMRRNHDAH